MTCPKVALRVGGRASLPVRGYLRSPFFFGKRRSLRNADQLSLGLCLFHDKWDFLPGMGFPVPQDRPRLLRCLLQEPWIVSVGCTALYGSLVVCA